MDFGDQTLLDYFVINIFFSEIWVVKVSTWFDQRILDRVWWTLNSFAGFLSMSHVPIVSKFFLFFSHFFPVSRGCSHIFLVFSWVSPISQVNSPLLRSKAWGRSAARWRSSWRRRKAARRPPGGARSAWDFRRCRRSHHGFSAMVDIWIPGKFHGWCLIIFHEGFIKFTITHYKMEA